MVAAFASSSVVVKGGNHAHFESETRAHDEVFHDSVQLQCMKHVGLYLMCSVNMKVLDWTSVLVAFDQHQQTDQ